ncbi:cyclic nucleotide-binding domain-containing protein [Stigmatella aurantiaca]|uniref:Cyclic nucleotide-binding domain protein n=1 Tax=Stigmatella aurantiaca (strain DW4/3-1) TaxID=378806 RepID=Q096Q4_STIAD|nr:cyclic nucleotide-binding domain-containing protein [Stigmatella aurantiaca]ADO68569.1 Cyclic nucleotide-binding domain protein [Stigmatella aurantiaca DW4/3-1]EAU67740.1 PKA regulatory subunit-like protein [Stigmatella aurantiaca DW4/3-1]
MTDTLQQHRQKGARFIALDHLEAALAEYEQLVKAAPDDGTGRQQVAELLERLGRKTQAVAAYEEAALAWARGGQLLRAIVVCKALLRLDPGHTRTQRSLADLFGWRVKPGVRSPASLTAMAEFELLPEGAGPAAGMPVVPLFSQLGREPFAAVLEAMEVRTHPAKHSVVVEGELGASMFALVEGTLEVVRHFQDGTRRKVGELAEGAFFGELALISEGPRLASVVAAGPVVLLEFTRAKLAELVRRHPGVGQVVQAFYRERMVENLLRNNPAFSLLKPEQKQAVVREFTLKAVAEGEVLLKQGQQGEAFYLLLRGCCTPYHVKPDGREQAYPELREGAVFGEISLLLGKPVTATVRANTASVVLRLDRAAFERLILGLPGIRGALMKVGTERLQRTAKLLSGREVHDGDLRV